LHKHGLLHFNGISRSIAYKIADFLGTMHILWPPFWLSPWPQLYVASQPSCCNNQRNIVFLGDHCVIPIIAALVFNAFLLRLDIPLLSEFLETCALIVCRLAGTCLVWQFWVPLSAYWLFWICRMTLCLYQSTGSECAHYNSWVAVCSFVFPISFLRPGHDVKLHPHFHCHW